MPWFRQISDWSPPGRDTPLDPGVDDVTFSGVLSAPYDESNSSNPSSSPVYQDLLTNLDYDDEDSDQAFENMLTQGEVLTSTFLQDSEPIPPLIGIPTSLSPSSSTNSLVLGDETILDEDIVTRDKQPYGSIAVSIELEVAQKYTQSNFSRQEQSMAALLSLFTSTGCRLSLFDEVLSRIKKRREEGLSQSWKGSDQENFPVTSP